MNIRDECPHCGKPVVFINNACPSCLADRNESVGDLEKRKHQETLTAFREFAKPRPLSATMNRLLLGAAIVATATFVAALLAPGHINFSMIGCVIGWWIASGVVFSRAQHVDKMRWLRFWLGDFLGYAVTYLFMMLLVPAHFAAGDWPFNYIIATVVAFGFGLLNMILNDKPDRSKTRPVSWSTRN